MKSRWGEGDVPDAGDLLATRVYSSRLIGMDRSLVLHGGGNTSVKDVVTDRFGEQHQVLHVKASGYDLATMGAEGFTGLLLAPVLRLAGLDVLSDDDMVAELKKVRLDPDAAAPSIEAIVHALVPYRFVDHSHADAVLTVSNSQRGRAVLGEIYGPRVKILPYVKPGFDLALQFRDFLRDGGFDDCDALILEHHGVFTFADNARESYERMVETVDLAESFLARTVTGLPPLPGNLSAHEIARARKAASVMAKRALLSLPGGVVPAEAAARLAALSRRGTVTPEHVLHNKPFGAFLDRADPGEGIETFAAEYRAYFERAGARGLTMLPAYPHWALFDDGSARSFGPNPRRAAISADVVGVTLAALYQADQLGGWQGLSESDLRDIEYWELEQAKLKRQPVDPALSGKIAVVAGAATGIGRATAELLAARGAIVAGIDIDPAIEQLGSVRGCKGYLADLRDETRVAAILDDVVRAYGGVDILVCNAGIFRAGASIENLADDDWDATLDINLSAHRKVLKRAIPYLKLGVDPGVVFVASRNVPAPGAGAAAYSVSKAGLTQLMRVAALELAGDGITVNAVHPDAVFDTNLWTQEALETSASRYGLSVDAYKQRNLLKAEIRSSHVASAIVAFVDGTLPRTTGAQLPVDGGNDRVI